MPYTSLVNKCNRSKYTDLKNISNYKVTPGCLSGSNLVDSRTNFDKMQYNKFVHNGAAGKNKK